MDEKNLFLEDLDDSQMFDLEEQDNGLGKIEISPEVLEVIASLAATEVSGVASMHGSFATGVAEKMGRRNYGKGVRVDLGEEGIVIDVSLHMVFGVSIPKVAQLVQENISQTLRTMTALEVKAINVHVVGIEFEQEDRKPNQEKPAKG
ncbi:Asp23/Gls24 family envelope stress response protein [Pullulanibacillus sp. KACC 23026]|uniref:Asp23/Gls24 family envelope stress response protein n=1 Tax=Pullulanibacillus sp. KACC 23026 TaxID=3028315 RepID=UPI0023B07B65|nr:Asp23/Gls24 family envelope stress response protein [Pullulanibacillus sp. KACC 23026]WEG14316.1 Asp23/Gls24 family envelope stress response protein [Pullulanibacillus sp. KACC 23026]